MSEVVQLLEKLPPTSLVPAAWVLEGLRAEEWPEAQPEPSWQQKIWTCPSETRISVTDLAEAVGRSSGWIYKRTQSKAQERLPHRKVNGGGLVFLAGEIREWLKAREAA